MHRSIIAVSSLALLACGGTAFSFEVPDEVIDAGPPVAAPPIAVDAGIVAVAAPRPHEVTPKSWTIFVTAETFVGGNLGGVAGADATCQSAANRAKLGSQWTAWLSTRESPVASRLNYVARGVDNAPFGLLNGTLIANNWTELTDRKIRSTIILDEYLHAVTTTPNVWTGTDGQGLYIDESAATNCNGWSSETGNGWIGQVNLFGNAWSKSGFTTCARTMGAHLYCFERTKESTL